jgi:hypothetical protein
MFRKRQNETDLELRLADARPEPPEELLHQLSAQMEPRRAPRRPTTPRIALVCAVAAGIVLSLGVAGALGSATGSINAFGRGVVHLVQAPSTASPDHSQGGGGGGGLLGPSDPRWWSHRDFPSDPPFSQQYAGRIPICWQGHIIFVTPFEYLWYFAHGASPARDCFLQR